MKYSLVTLSLLITFIFFGFIVTKHSTHAFSTDKVINGQIDLSKIDFNMHSLIELNGDWEFYWNQLLYPQDFKNEQRTKVKTLFAVPQLWNGKTNHGIKLNGIGFATYRLRFKTNKSLELLAIKTQRIETAHKIWIDGQLLFQTGCVSQSKDSAKAYWYPTEIFFKNDSTNHEIIIQVSNFNHRKGGISSSLMIGKPVFVSDKTMETNGFTVFIIGALLIIGLYHLVLFSLRTKDLSTLFFGLTTLLTALNALTAGEFIIVKLVDGFSWEWVVKINFITNFMRITSFSLFLGNILPNRSERIFNRSLFAVCCALSLFVLFTKAILFSHLIVPFEVLALVMMIFWIFNLTKAAFHHKTEVSFSIIGTIILFATAVNDILKDSLQLHTMEMVPFGLFIFVLFQAIMLSIRSSRTINEVETLGEKMVILDTIKNEFLKNTTHDLGRHLQIIIQNLGAEKGILLLTKNKKLHINYIAFNDGKPEKFESLPFDMTDKKMERHILPTEMISDAISSDSNVIFDPNKKTWRRIDPYFDFNPVKSAVSVPLYEEKELIGVIYLETTKENAFTDVKLNVLELLKSQITTIIENDKIYDELEALNKNLEIKVEERTMEVMQQKEEIITQKDELEEASEILREALAEISLKNRDITDSINYAKRIQQSIFPNVSFLKALLPDSFVFFKPKHILSGDFYWFDTFYNADEVGQLKTEKLIVAAVDCTGHGVPGALMSIIGNNLLNHAMNEMKLMKPNEILDELQNGIHSKLKSTDESLYNHDGMDLAIINYEFITRKLLFAGAKNPLVHFRNDHMTIYKGSQNSIGGFQKNNKEKDGFECHEIKIEPNDIVYIFSDGYMDQTGGTAKRKLMRKGFYELLNAIHHKKMDDQLVSLENAFEEWKEDLAQVDDVLVIGIKFN